MDATERLYYRDSHLREFDARVTSVSGADAGGRVAVTLDRTAFYPTGGGQPTDTGTLGGARVVECVDEEGGRGVLHLVEGASAPEVGALVRGRIDWPRRLDHLQQHTGQHILSQAFVELFGAQTRGFRMMSEASEVDVELADPSDERVEQAVNRADEIIWDDRPVRVRQVTAEEAARMPLRRDSAREGELRIIEIEGFDLSPCGGTHARRTGEVGLVAVRSWERAKGLTRVTFVAGARALSDYRRANHTARSVASMFSAARDEAANAVARLLEEHKQLQRRARALGELAARAEARELLEEASTIPGLVASTGAASAVSTGGASGDAPGGGGVRLVARVLEARDAEGLKRLASALAAHAGTVALLGSREGADARLVFARSPDAPGDMNALMREACRALEGRGGGRPDMAQGGGPRTDRLAHALEHAARTLAPEPDA
jgi:alanyl-tRNA synthetase